MSTIGILLCLCSAQPLASIGNGNEVWFVGDQDPTVLNFDSSTKGFDYSICRRISNDAFTPVQRLSRRPVDMVLHEGNIWFVDDVSGTSLYTLQLTRENRQAHSRNISLQSVLEVEETPTGVVSLGSSIVVCYGGDTLQLHSFNGSVWEELPSLNLASASVASLEGELLAVAPHQLGAELWSLIEGKWQGGEVVEMQGTFREVLIKDRWPLLIFTEGQRGQIIGLQESAPIEIGSFDVPKGRWSVVASPLGLSILGVERNGTTSVVDIGWPSGREVGRIELKQEFLYGLSFLEKYPFLIAALLLSLFILLRTRKATLKKQKNEGS
ncbi:MAG: hypothetical protein ISR75_01370 [Phycisphaerales bacterium]|nr:hypothetical protein [Planctomycetota bacterium]MBL6997075.1 hypothetical protein [Phycisphaerales bacterium]